MSGFKLFQVLGHGQEATALKVALQCGERKEKEEAQERLGTIGGRPIKPISYLSRKSQLLPRTGGKK